MARTTITQVTDDIDGSEGAEEVQFAYAGTSYTIDLNKKNRQALEKALRPYIAKATKVSGRKPAASGRARRSTAARSDLDLSAVRAWASENGYELSSRGRVPQAVLEAYRAAHA